LNESVIEISPYEECAPGGENYMQKQGIGNRE